MIVAICGITLPTKIGTAPQAELVAIGILLALLPRCPAITTDCLSVLKVARGTAAAATHPRRPLAGEWRRILSYLDGQLDLLARRLTWAPAHKSAATAMSMRRSDGHLCTLADWRANRVVDVVAKAHARVDGMEMRHGTISSCLEAVAHATAVLGCVTYAAAHVVEERLGVDGTLHRRTRRDSEPTTASHHRRARRRGSVRLSSCPTTSRCRLARRQV